MEIGLEIEEQQIGVILIHQVVDQRHKQTLVGAAETAVPEALDDLVDIFVGPADLQGSTADVQPLVLCLFGGHAEKKEVFLTDLLPDLDIGAVKGADGEGAVQGEFHIAGAGGLGTGR